MNKEKGIPILISYDGEIIYFEKGKDPKRVCSVGKNGLGMSFAMLGMLDRIKFSEKDAEDIIAGKPVRYVFSYTIKKENK